MRNLVILFVHLAVTLARVARPGGLRSVVAESILIKHQLVILNRGRERPPNLRTLDRIILGFCTLFRAPDSTPSIGCQFETIHALASSRSS